jgi:uncharacterized membrane protein YbhN (UPF0104 family)
VVDLSLLEWIGFGCIIWFVLWAVVGVMSILFAFVAGDVGEIFLDIGVEAAMSVSPLW